MRQRILLLVLLLMLAAGGAAAWLVLTRTEPAPANQFIADDPRASRQPRLAPKGTAEHKLAPEQPDVRGVAGKPPAVPGTAVATPATPEPPETRDWEVKGRFVSLKAGGVELLGRLRDCNDLVLLQYRVFEGDDHTVHWLQPECTSNGEFKDTISIGQLSVEQAVHAWFHAVNTETIETPLYQPDFDPRTASIPGLVKPTIRDHIIDLGDLSLDVSASLTSPFLLVGRLLGPGDTPLASTQSFEIGFDYKDDESMSEYIHPNRLGQFATQLDFDYDDSNGGPLAEMRWWIEVSSDDDDWRMRTIDEFAEQLDRVPLPAPVRKGNVLDFGDIRMAGALIEVLVEIEGMAGTGPAGDSLLDEYFEYTSFVNLAAGDNSFESGLIPGVPLRLIVPEGRYTWRAEVQQPDLYCPPAEGAVAARHGEVCRIHAVLKPAAMIPVTVLDPAGNVLNDADVYWEIAFRPEDWLTGNAIKGNLVPVLPGKTTAVSASHDRFEGADGEAPPGTTSLTIKFKQAAEGLGHISVKLPLLPKELGLPKLKVRMYICDSGRDDSHLDEHELVTDSQATVDARSWVPETYRLQLRGGDCFGYPGGVLSEISGIELKDGDSLELEFPPVASPPWNIPIGECLTRLSVGGDPAALYGTWVYGNVDGRGWIQNNDRILNATPAKDGNESYGRIPSYLKSGEVTYPVQLTMPTEAWGQATASLDMPTRLTVRIQRRGQPVPHFTSTLSNREGGSRVWCGNGVAHLWCPPGRANLDINIGLHSIPDHELVISDTAAELVIELDKVKVVFVSPKENEARWTYAPSDTPQSSDWIDLNSEMLLAARRYLIRPSRELDQSAAFELDLTDGADREVTLPHVEPAKYVDIHLAMTETDWKNYNSGEFWSWQPVEGFDKTQSVEFEYSRHSLAVRALPDSLVLRGVPLGRTILLQGISYRRADNGALEVWFLQPCQFTAAAENRIAPVWRKGVKLHDDWGNIEIRSTSAFAGYWTNPVFDMWIAPGRQEIVVVGPEENEAARAMIDVPADAAEFRIPTDLRRRLETAGMLDSESGDE